LLAALVAVVVVPILVPLVAAIAFVSVPVVPVSTLAPVLVLALASEVLERNGGLGCDGGGVAHQ
jgi:hypothetical protein